MHWLELEAMEEGDLPVMRLRGSRDWLGSPPGSERAVRGSESRLGGEGSGGPHADEEETGGSESGREESLASLTLFDAWELSSQSSSSRRNSAGRAIIASAASIASWDAEGWKTGAPVVRVSRNLQADKILSTSPPVQYCDPATATRQLDTLERICANFGGRGSGTG